MTDSDTKAQALVEAAQTIETSWFTMNIAHDEPNAKLMHDWLMRRAQWLRGEEETYGLESYAPPPQ